MKKIGTITFHSSYNYGSCLQAYAMQEYIKKNYNDNYEYKIINLRTPIQKYTYSNFWKKKGIKNLLKKILFFTVKKDLIKKECLFEEFINNKLNITKEYSSLEEIRKDNLNFDYYISGSDQLWNLRAFDFDWANYLEFVDKGKKISYAASFGDKKQTWTKEEEERVIRDIKSYDYLSVREKGSYDLVKDLTGLEPSINIDPTMLLSQKEWLENIDSKRLIKDKYIFFYNLKGDKKNIKLAKKIGKKLRLPVIISKCSNVHEIIGFKKKFDVGPLEFLNLINNAELVISTSFHGTVFSILLKRPFYALNGIKDYRISTLLEKMKLKDRNINYENFNERIEKAFDISFDNVDKILDEEIKKSKDYIDNCLK